LETGCGPTATTAGFAGRGFGAACGPIVTSGAGVAEASALDTLEAPGTLGAGASGPVLSTMRASRTETAGASPPTTVRSVVMLGPVTTTRPSIIVSMKVSAIGSQAASKVVPVTRTSKGPARTAHRAVPAPAGWTTAACTVPRSISTSAPA